jgi:protein O-GlcNAc transferase
MHDVTNELQSAIQSMNRGDFRKADQILRHVKTKDERNFDAIHMLGIVCTELGKLYEAEQFFKVAISIDSKYPPLYRNYGLFLSKINRFQEAIEKFNIAISLAPSFAPVYSDRGNCLRELGKLDEAINDHNRAISFAPEFFGFYNNRGNALQKKSRHLDALADFDTAIRLNPNCADAYCGRGNVYKDLKRYDEAFAAYDKALSINSDLAEAWIGRGNVYTDLKRYDEAFAAYDKALSIKSDLAEAWVGRGNVFTDLKRYDDAIAAYDKALSIKSDLAEAWVGRGNVFTDLKRYDEAFAAYDKALALRPDSANAWVGRGNVFSVLKRYNDALEAYGRGLMLKSDLAEAWLGRGNVFDRCKCFEEAVSNYTKALAIDPEYPFVKGQLLYQKMLCCDWKGVGDLIAEINRDVASSKQSAQPFGYQAISDSARNLRRCAEIFAADKYPRSQTPLWRGERYNNEKIRLGYLSGEFRYQATSILMAELFELHDKNRFELFAFDNGWDDGSGIRKRINRAFDAIVDISSLDDLQTATTIKQKQIDILVNLNGYFGEERTEVFSRRPAPIQVSYLGFPGTMGTDYIDYLIADPCVIPPEQQACYAEKIAYLPETYQVNDTKRAIAEREPTRAEAMLPKTGFVFCCFNNSYKITPEIFELWMRLLHKVNGSTLWLLEANAAVPRNLRREADRLGILPERLIFAQPVNLPEHLARHRLADLFLDTLPYNAHTTASDALWAGVPVLTCLGSTFPGRVAASLLQAIGLSELITTSLSDYEALALKLAHESSLLQAVKAKLVRNRDTYPLFDTVRFTRHIEAAYVTMWERYQRREEPQAFAVAPID